MSPPFVPGTGVALVNLHRHCENSAFWLGRLERYLRINGYRLVPDPADAEVVAFNTCALTDELAAGLAREMASIAARCPRAWFVVLGCLASFPERLLPITGAFGTTLVPTQAFDTLDALFHGEVPWRSAIAHRAHDLEPYQPFVGPDDTFVVIAQGCANRCAYCSIRLAKGPVRSRSPEAIAAEVGALLAEGTSEITLLADDCGSYGLDIGTDLALLLSMLLERFPDLRIKVYTLFPALFLRFWDRLKPCVSTGRIRYLCMPLQSGSPEVLARMGRPLDLDLLHAAIAEIRRLSPDLRLYSHFMVGFPGETDADFERSLALAERLDGSLFLPYGENRATPAASLGPRCTADAIARRLGRVREALADGRLPPHTTVLGDPE